MSQDKIPSTSHNLPNVRTRFAPSPTGLLHVGAARTALFAWIVSKSQSGEFILRIEDTDKLREVEGSITHIQDSLKWLGIDWNEGVGKGGEFEPYIQSQRLDTYKQWAQKLIDSGRAYVDTYSKEELEAMRESSKASKKPFLYREHRPEVLETSNWQGKPLRFKSEPKAYTWTDAVMGELSASEEAIDDFIIMKADGFPTYNFCHIVDDSIMKITHVLRSQEFISSTPKFLNLYEALGVDRPILATLPYVMAIDGKKKLSKRDGAKDLLDYGREGYLPEAMLNFLATLGWNDGSEQEIFSTQEIIEKFDLSRIQKSPARFDEQRLLWLNGQHIRNLSLDELFVRVNDFWPKSAENADESKKKQILSLVQDRLKTLSDLSTLTSYFFEEPTVDWSMIEKNKQLSNFSKDDISSLLKNAKDAFQTSEFDPESIQNTLNNLLESTNQKPAILFSLIRIAVSWAPFSPSLNETLSTLGKDTVLRRLELAIPA